jgi:hypothetical protein
MLHRQVWKNEMIEKLITEAQQELRQMATRLKKTGKIYKDVSCFESFCSA